MGSVPSKERVRGDWLSETPPLEVDESREVMVEAEGGVGYVEGEEKVEGEGGELLNTDGPSEEVGRGVVDIAAPAQSSLITRDDANGHSPQQSRSV